MTLFLTARVVHVLLAAVWFGSSAFLTFVMMPAVNAAGPSGGQVMLALNRKGIVQFFATVSGITILTGFYLYWRTTDGFAPGSGAMHANMAYGAGGIAGLAASIIGGSIVGRSSKKVVDIMGRVAAMPEGAEKSGLVAQAGELRQKMASFGLIVVILQAIAATLMVIARFI